MNTCCDKKFVVGRSYYAFDHYFDPITVIKRTPKCIVVRGGSGNEWRMLIRKSPSGNEMAIDSTVPVRWRDVFTYCADDYVPDRN